MNQGQPPSQPNQVAHIGPDASSGVSIWVKHEDFQQFLEELLRSSRSPRWLLPSIMSTIAIPAVLGVAQVVNDQFATSVIFLVAVLISIFVSGVALGRWLRPIPTPEEIEKFAAKTRRDTGFVDHISKSRDLVRQIGVDIDHASGFSGRLGLVDLDAMTAIIDLLGRRLSNDAGRAYVKTSPSATRKFYGTHQGCAECGKTVQVEGAADCSVCGTPLCSDCVGTHPECEPIVCIAHTPNNHAV